MKYDFSAKSSFQEYFGPAHDMVRRAAKEFVDKEIVPCVDEWEEAGEFPRELYKKAGDVGLHGIGYPEEWGGTPGDIFGIIRAETQRLLPTHQRGAQSLGRQILWPPGEPCRGHDQSTPESRIWQ